MTSLELLIRPFQSKDVTPPKRIIGAEKTVDPVNVSIGSAGGTALVFRAFAVIEFKVEDDFTYKEIERKTHTKRIENPDDPSQFVDVERIDRISLRHKLKPDDKRIYEIKNND
jgi:hypothetical protein